LGEEPGEDLSAVTTPAQRVAMVTLEGNVPIAASFTMVSGEEAPGMGDPRADTRRNPGVQGEKQAIVA
jgi:hypothetical protein